MHPAPGDFGTSGLSDALVILGAAGIVIPAFARFRISPVIGFILIGLLVGPAGLGSLSGQYPWLNYVTISNRESIEPFAEFGIILLLFSIGLELSFKRLWGMRRLVFGVGAAELLIGAAFIGLALYLIGTGPSASVALGLALALSSTALVLPLTNAATAVGRSALAMLLFEDLAIVPIIFALGALSPHVGLAGLTNMMNVLLAGAAVVAAMLILGRLFLHAKIGELPKRAAAQMYGEDVPGRGEVHRRRIG